MTQHSTEFQFQFTLTFWRYGTLKTYDVLKLIISF